MTVLSADRLKEMIRSSMYDEGEVSVDAYETGKLPAGAMIVEGITAMFVFKPDRLEVHRDEALLMIDQLNDNFKVGGGGGWSFLNLCMDKDENQWTGFHQAQEMLVVICMGLGLARYVLPRAMWSSFPGGMPYVQFGALPEKTGDKG